MNVTFTSSPLLDTDDRNLVGTVTEQGQLKQHLSRWSDENGTVRIMGKVV